MDLFCYTLKRITPIPVKRNDTIAINKRAEYAQDFLEILAIYDESNMYFVDEVGFNVTMRSRRGRSLKGTRAVHIVHGLRARNISVCCAMSKSGIVKFVKQTCAFQTTSFNNFIETIQDDAETLQIGPIVIFMDNVPFHKSTCIRESVQNRGNKIMFLPPYSPFLNPIENMFSKWKQSIRQRRPNDETELFAMIDDVENVITPSDCASYFRHMISFISRCLKREVIIDE